MCSYANSSGIWSRPVRPPVAPVAAMRVAASAVVSQVMLWPESARLLCHNNDGIAHLVPAELTSGSATHVNPPLHGVTTNFPLAHCAKLPCTHATSPEVHDEEGVRVLNLAFSFCASRPFCFVNDARAERVERASARAAS